jgi:O-antigen/teichoic acid export membrane protein
VRRLGAGVPPKKEGIEDYLKILSGTSQNVAGIVIAALATLGAQVLMTRVLGAAGFGVVTVVAMAAFVLSFATRAGMDMAVLRDVAVEVGADRTEVLRARVARAAAISAGVSAVVTLALLFGAGAVRALFNIPEGTGRGAVEAAALGLPFIALTNVWLGATRGLKIMRYTLYIFWVGQPLAWIVLMLAGWQFSQTPGMSVAAYSGSWALAAGAAYLAWSRESRGWGKDPMVPGDLPRLLRYAGPRAPAALFGQLLFWADLFVVTRYVVEADVGIYSAALRAGHVVVLFLTSVNLMFSPYVADLYNRGEMARLDRLFKTLTRWIVAATLPAFLLLAVAPEPALRVFGAEFAGGSTALLILLAGQFVNIATGSAGFVLIMAGRTGWDLAVHTFSLTTSLTLAFLLAPVYGIEGAAVANAVTFAASNSLRLALVRRFVGIQPYDRDYLRLVLPAVLGAAAMWATRTVADVAWPGDLAATAAAGALVYALAYLLWGLTDAERKGARKVAEQARGR